MGGENLNGLPVLPDGWAWEPLENLSERVSVGHVGETSSVFTDSAEGITFLRSQNVRPGKIELNEVKYVKREFHFKSKKSQLKAGDILVVRVGQNRGDCAIVPEGLGELNCANIVFARLKDKKFSGFIGYFLNSRLGRSLLMAVSTGSAQGVLNTKSVAKVLVPVPPEDYAFNVGAYLGLFDSKIDLNQQTNQTLEQMAQALFKSWFVDFDPVIDNALAAGSEIPDALQHRVEIRNKAHAQQKQNPNIQPLPVATQRLFPSEFEHCGDNTLGIQGWIPKSWEVTSFESLISLVGGGTPKTTIDDYWGGDIPWFSVVDAPNDSDVFVIDTEKHVTQLGVNKSSTKILREGTTIISARGTVGKCALVGSPMAMNQSCYGIVGKFENHDEYIYFLTRYQVSDLQKRGHGSVFNTITRETFKSISLAKSDDLLTQKFSELARRVRVVVLSSFHNSYSQTAGG